MEPLAISCFLVAAGLLLIALAALHHVVLRCRDQRQETSMGRIFMRMLPLVSVIFATSEAAKGFLVIADPSEHPRNDVYRALRVVCDSCYDFAVLLGWFGLYIFVYEMMRTARVATRLFARDRLRGFIRGVFFVLSALNILGYLVSNLGRPLANRQPWTVPFVVTLMLGACFSISLLLIFFCQLRHSTERMRGRKESNPSSSTTPATPTTPTPPNPPPAQSTPTTPASLGYNMSPLVPDPEAKHLPQVGRSSSLPPDWHPASQVTANQATTNQPTVNQPTASPRPGEPEAGRTEPSFRRKFLRFQSCVLSVSALVSAVVVFQIVLCWRYVSQFSTLEYFNSPFGWDMFSYVTVALCSITLVYWYRPHLPPEAQDSHENTRSRANSNRGVNSISNRLGSTRAIFQVTVEDKGADAATTASSSSSSSSSAPHGAIVGTTASGRAVGELDLGLPTTTPEESAEHADPESGPEADGLELDVDDDEQDVEYAPAPPLAHDDVEIHVQKLPPPPEPSIRRSLTSPRSAGLHPSQMAENVEHVDHIGGHSNREVTVHVLEKEVEHHADQHEKESG
eukprot:TRINITY_DN1793_c0_g1_i1.p1 TRINITY_DN1793_c0_g1~~TRINITY_DN1793_c0_g1_i1.p1  ORF type:complete len:568 (-),score=83.55 TRINITY_DN1793_c0_g1_i1:214-1917(-)